MHAALHDSAAVNTLRPRQVSVVRGVARWTPRQHSKHRWVTPDIALTSSRHPTEDDRFPLTNVCSLICWANPNVLGRGFSAWSWQNHYTSSLPVTVVVGGGGKSDLLCMRLESWWSLPLAFRRTLGSQTDPGTGGKQRRACTPDGGRSRDTCTWCLNPSDLLNSCHLSASPGHACPNHNYVGRTPHPSL